MLKLACCLFWELQVIIQNLKQAKAKPRLSMFMDKVVKAHMSQDRHAEYIQNGDSIFGVIPLFYTFNIHLMLL